MMGRRRRTPEPASWAEMIREYQNEKRTVGAANVENVSVRNAQARALRFEQQSEYDPVCHRFRDPVKEKAVLDEERRKSIKMMNGGLDKARAQEASYDIITQKMHPSSQKAESTEMKKKVARSGANYNIINLRDANNNLLKAGADDEEARAKAAARHSSQFQRPLDYDIISNRYFHDHDDRFKNEEQAKKLEIARKYSRHKTFNPIKGTYYIDKINEEKELEEKQEKEAKRIQQRANLPQAITNSEGYMYNITTLEVKRPDVLQARDEESRRKKEQWKLRYRAEAKFYDDGVREAELAKVRAENRVSVSRSTEAVRHGYNIISNEVSTLNEAQKKTFDSRKSLWDQVRGLS